jgi:hypothetical protein
MAHLRGHGVARLLVYCGSLNCNHKPVMDADQPSDDTAIRPLGDRLVCSRCGHRGADVRPDWAQRSTPGPGAAHSHRFEL